MLLVSFRISHRWSSFDLGDSDPGDALGVELSWVALVRNHAPDEVLGALLQTFLLYSVVHLRSALTEIFCVCKALCVTCAT